MSTPGSSARGLQHAIWLVSFSHGRAQLPVVSAISIDPQGKEEVVGEMGTPYGVLTVQFYDKVSFQVDYTTTDDDTTPSLVMDTVPSSAQGSVYAPHLTYQAPFSLFGNQTHMTSGKIFQGFVVAQCMGLLTKKQSKEGNEQVSIKGTGTQVWIVNANRTAANVDGAIDYNRGVAASPPYATTEDKTFSANAITLNKAAVAFPLPGTGGLTQNYVLVLKNGKPVTTGFTISGSTFTLSVAPAATDVWEVFTVYLP